METGFVISISVLIMIFVVVWIILRARKIMFNKTDVIYRPLFWITFFVTIIPALILLVIGIILI